MLRNDGGPIEVHQSLPSSRWIPLGTDEWRYDGNGGATTKAKVSLKNSELTLSIKGRDGDFHVDTFSFDPQLELIFGGDPGATAGQCLT